MSILVGAGHFPGPRTDPRLQKLLTVLTTCEVPEPISQAFFLVTIAIAEQMKKEGIAFNAGLPINCFFIDDRSFTVSLSPDQLAVCMRLAVYPVGVLLSAASQPVLMMLLAEELCHLIWNMPDEVQINCKVLEVLQNLDPTLTLQRLGYRTEA